MDLGIEGNLEDFGGGVLAEDSDTVEVAGREFFGVFEVGSAFFEFVVVPAVGKRMALCQGFGVKADDEPYWATFLAESRP